MASGTANPSGPVLVAGTSLQHEQIIELQLARARRRIKRVDLGCQVMTLAGAITTFLLVVAGIDHWLVDLGTWGRWTALLGLVLGVTYYCAAILVPLLLRRINPAYAARAIEQTNPSLKNSLLNFLTFRRDNSPTSRLVHQALRQRAALDLQRVNIELAVDRMRLIRIGYTVVALMTLLAVYTILSPKNVFQTLHRVLAPWAAIARPSRVAITDVRPGSSQLVYGARPAVSARIVGVRAGESAQVRYSTLDRQTLDRSLPMQQATGESRFASTLPAEPAGLQQDLVYWIEAGDARSPDFRLTVLPTPTILVEQMTYHYPAYTRRPPRVVEREGAIEAMEGTQVTIRARTNHPIQDARIEFDVDAQRSPEAPAATSQPMTCQGQTATCDFTLRFQDPERSQPEHANYRLIFSTRDGLRSEPSMVYRIAFFRDLPPEVAILTPRETAIELAADARQRLEIRALDPDYGLSRVVLHARTGGRNLLDQELLSDPAGRTGQVLLNYDFTPRHWQLQPGDQVTYWVSVDDNRTSPGKNEPDPNTQRTRDYTLTIVGPDSAASEAAPAPGDAGASRPDTGSPDPTTQPRASDAAEGGQGAGGSAGPQAPGGRPDAADSSPSASGGAPGTPPAPGGESASAAEEPPGQQSGDRPQQADQGDQASSADSGQSGDASAGGGADQKDSQQSSAAGQAGSSGQSGAAGSDSQQSPDTSAGAASGASGGRDASADGAKQNEDGQGTGSSAQPGNRPGAAADGTGSQQTGTASAAGDAASAPDSRATPAGQAAGDGATAGPRSEPLHDGEAFERALEHFRQESAGAAGGTSPAPSPRSPGQPSTEQSTGGADPPTSPASGAEGNAAGSAPQPGAADSPGGPPTPDGTHQGSPATRPDGTGGDAPSPRETGRDTHGGDAPSPRETSRDTRGGDAPSPRETGRDTRGGDAESSAGGVSGERGAARPDARGAAAGGAPGEVPEWAAEREPGDAQGKSPAQPSGGAAGASKTPGAAPPAPSGDQRPARDADVGNQPESSAADRPGDTPGAMPGEASAPQTGAAPGPTPSASPERLPGANMPPGADTPPGTAPQPAPGDQAGTDAPLDGGTTAPGSAEQSSQTPPHANDPGGHPSTRSPRNGGQPGADTAPPPPTDTAEPVADTVNLDYARRATDLVLERLRQEQHDPDAALLESLGWSADDLRRFVARWEELKRAAREEGPAAQAELDDALRSLGLRSTAASARRESAPDDQQRGLREAGHSAVPPPEYRDLFNAYKKGAARGAAFQGPREP